IVGVLDLHHRGTETPEERLVGARNIWVDQRDEPQADQVREGGESTGKVPAGGLDHRCLVTNLPELGRSSEDPVGGAILDTPNWVDIFEFGKQIHALHCQLHMWRGSYGISKLSQTRGETGRRNLIEMF